MDPRDSPHQAHDAEPGGVEDLGVGEPQHEAPHRRELPVGRPDVRVAAGVVAALVVLVIAIILVLFLV